MKMTNKDNLSDDGSFNDDDNKTVTTSVLLEDDMNSSFVSGSIYSYEDDVCSYNSTMSSFIVDDMNSSYVSSESYMTDDDKDTDDDTTIICNNCDSNQKLNNYGLCCCHFQNCDSSTLKMCNWNNSSIIDDSDSDISNATRMLKKRKIIAFNDENQ